jgi:rod shape-determining protein MreC
VYRKQVRRRRAVLALLVLSSFALLTATYGEQAGGLQKGVSAVFGPLQEGADRALKPARDLINWFDETFDARGENDRLRSELEELRRQVVGSEVAIQENAQLKQLLELRESGVVPSGYEEVTARVIARSPSVWYGRVRIDRGASAGVKVDDPVVTGAGLVGTVSSVTRGGATVTLITDPGGNGVSAKITENGTQGVLGAEVGDPEDLTLDYVEADEQIARGDTVVTAGWRAPEFESKYPPNLPIGVVSRAPIAEQEAVQQVHVRPFAEIRELDFVMVLTGGSR